MGRQDALLERWGRFSVRKRWWVIGGWVLVLALLGIAARSLAEGTVNSLDIPGAESQEAVEVLEASFPERSGDYGDIVFRAQGGISEPGTRASIESLLTRVAEVPEVVAVSSPYQGTGAMVSADGTTGIARVQFSEGADAVSAASVEEVERLIESARSEALQVEFGGPVPASQEREGPNESTVLGLIAALIILLILFRTLVPTALPLVTAMSGLAAGFAIVFAMTAVVDLSKFAPNIGAMIGLGVGVDYALFIVARHREQVLAGHTIEEAAGIALATAGKSVLFAGGVVVTSLLGLFLMGIPFVGWLGAAAAIMVAVAVVVAMTLLPALLGVAGRTVVHLGRRRQEPAPANHEASSWYRLGHAIMRRPYLFLGASTFILVALSIPVLDLRLGSADAGNNPTSTTTRRAYDIVSEEFGPGANGPLMVVVQGASPDGLARIREAVAAAENVAAVSEPMVNETGDTAILAVTPGTAPQDEATTGLVHLLRDDVLPAAAGEGVTTYVGGTTARYIDIADRIGERLPLFFALVIGISFVLLMVVFRSLLIPLKAALMNLLSIGAAYGVIVAVFQWGWALELTGADRTGPVESFLPMMLFAVLFGLSMDYEVFLVSRIREEFLHSGDNARSVARGLTSTASVITAAATIMIVVFLSFVMNDQRVVKEFGLGLAVAVFIDATVVRLLLVPATMELMGSWNWWLPGWLDRLLPRISIEGAEPGPAAVAATAGAGANGR